MRLIDADAIEYVVSEEGCQDDYAFRYDINEMPTIDAVPVVRCRECIYYNTTGCSDGFGWCEDSVVNTGTHDDFFCACGRREAGDA